MKLSLGKKILGGFVICSLVLILVAFISFRNSENLVYSSQWVNHTHEVLNEFDQVMVSALDAETGERGYIITGDENYLEPFHHAKSALSEHIDRVRQLTKDNEVQQGNIGRIERLADTLLKHLEVCISARKMQDLEKTRALVATGEGKRLLDLMRKEVSEAQQVEQTLLAERKQASEADARSFNLIFIVLLSVIAVVLISVYLIITNNLKALKKAEQETAQKNWTLTGSGDLIKDMQGNKQLTELTQTIINHLATWLEAQAGALYIAEEDAMHLRMVSAYAMAKRKDDLPLIPVGQGLAGQCAAEKKTILVTRIPAGQFTISTSFGEMVPEHIIAMPVIFEGSVVAVIELGSIHGFPELQQQYLQVVKDNI